MKKEQLEKFRNDLSEFEEMTDKFYRKEIDVASYKAFSGGFGSYAQRGGEKSMLRLRFAGGEITKSQFQFIVENVEKYNVDMIHLTTCQTVQMHNLDKDTVCALAKDALSHGIVTRGSGGDYPRNVMCSPLSGIEQEEYFDVLSYAKATGEYLLTLIDVIKLPRKLKVCFSNGTDNAVHATYRDLGFVATKEGRFDVYAAGGLGVKPKIGVKVAGHALPEDVLYYVKTMVDVFVEYGDYVNRGKARTRFLQDTLTPEGLVKIYQQKLTQNMQDCEMKIKPVEAMITKQGERDLAFAKENKRVIAQKQQGLFAVSFHPPGGILKLPFLKALYRLLRDMDEVKIRLTPDQGMYIINLNKEEAQCVLKLTYEDQGTLFEKSTACIGADICQVGIGKSQHLLRACMERVKQESFEDGVLPHIHISGCPSSCAAHQTAALGFRGGKKRTETGADFAYAVYENGSSKMGEERFATELGVLFEKDIPQFLVELGRAVSEKKMTYEQFRKAYPEFVSELVKKFD